MAPSRVVRGCGVLIAVGLLDVAIRLGSGWSMVWVVRAEATLFRATSLGLLMLHLRRPTQGLARTVQLGLAASFLLGGLRAALWALGMQVPRANLVIAILAVVGGALVLWRRRTPTVALVLVAVLACGQAPRQAASDAPAPRAVPVYQEPKHRLVFQSALVRVLDVRIGPGDTTAYHIHADPMVGIAVQDARIRIQGAGSPLGAVASPRATPYVFDNWSQALPYTHRVVNTDTLPLHYVVAEWLARSGPEAPALPDDANRHLVNEGPTTRVYQVTLAPGTATEPHTHATPGLVVLATAGPLREEGGGRAEGGTGAGSWSWRESAEPHVLRNGGTTRLIIYEIDWR
jgi:quercetin dioxygenase-like cupin family protein